MKKLTEKETKRINELVNKVLVEKLSLDEKELKELQAILKKLNDIEEEQKASKNELSEILDVVADKALINFALKKQKQVVFDKLPTNEKLLKLKEDIAKLQKGAYGKLKAEEEKQAKEREFEEYYQAHVRKHGNK